MNSGKILTGFALVMLSIAMTITPSSAAGCEESCTFWYILLPQPGEAGCPADCTPAVQALFLTPSSLSDATYPYER